MNEIGRAAEKCLAAAAKFGQVILITNSDDGWVHYSCKRYIPNLLPALNKYRIVSARTEYESFYPGSPLCWKAACFAHEVNETFAELEIKRNRLNSMSMGVHSHSHSHSHSQLQSHETSDSSMGLSPTSPAAFDSLNSTDDSSDDSMDERKSRLVKHRPKSSMMDTSTSTGRDTSREVISFGDSMEERTAVKIISKQLTAMPKSVMFISSPTPEQLIGQLSMLENHMKYICTHKSALDLEISPHQAQKSAISILARRKEAHDREDAVRANQGCRVQSSSTQGQYLQANPMGNSVSRMKRVSDRFYDETFSV